MAASFTDIGKATLKEYGNDHIARHAAAFSFYTFASFFPLLLVIISLLGYALSAGLGAAQDAQQYVLDTVSNNLPAAQDIIRQVFDNTQQEAGTAGLVGLLTGLWAASNIFAHLDQSFSVIYDIAPRKQGLAVKIKRRLTAALFVILLAVLLLGSLIFGAVITSVESFAASLPGGPVLSMVLNIVISLVLGTLIIGSLYKYIPDKPVSWKAALIGGGFFAVGWQIGRELLVWWLGRDTGSVTAGTAVGSVLAFLFLIYYASQLLMLGAELAATYDEMVNPDLVRHRTTADSPLRGPGLPPVTDSGKMVMDVQPADTKRSNVPPAKARRRQKNRSKR